MSYQKEFFDLQFSFAEVVRELSGESLDAVLLAYTNFYVRFGLGRAFNADHPRWQSYLAGLLRAEDERAWTYRFYLRAPELKSLPQAEAAFGCFAYTRPHSNLIRLHFQSAAPTQISPLGEVRSEQRRAELGALFAHLKPRVNRETAIVGASWLYNLQAYRRLFPPEYVAGARPIPGAFRSMALWGQFLDRNGRLKKPIVESFLNALSRASHLGDLVPCFPLQALTVRAPARVFYRFYGI